MNLLSEIDSELSAYGHGRPLSKEKALELSAACRSALRNLAAAIIEGQLYARCPGCTDIPIKSKCPVCHGIELIPEGMTVRQLLALVDSERELKRRLAEIQAISN